MHRVLWNPGRWRRASLGLVLGLLMSPVAVAEEGWGGVLCRHCLRQWLAEPEQPPGGRHYAPDRSADILHLAIDVTPDFNARTLQATTILRCRPVARPLTELVLDAVDLRVSSVEASAPLADWTYDDRHLGLTFSPPVPMGTEVTVTVRYSAAPRQGLYFRTPQQGYRPGDTHLWTQGEPVEARHWIPCFDAPNERFTSEITCRVPAGMKAVANGRLDRREVDPDTGLTAFRWVQDRPHVAYLVCLVAGHFESLEDRHRDVPLAFHTPPSRIAQAASSFQGTAAMMEFFEQELGMPFPWAKYDQAVVDDFTAGGMENTTLTTLTHRTLFTADFEGIRSSRGLVAHELAHQWFGDLVTCKDWSHLWLNEGFATYYDALQARQSLGEEEFRYEMLGNLKAVLGAGEDRTPIVWRRYGDPMEQFGYRAYPKGAWILHMLRHQLGEAMYRSCVQAYLKRHAGDAVVTADLVRAFEDTSGRSWEAFFDQYVYHARQPELSVDYAWDASGRQARIRVSQTQKVDDQVLLFDVPLDVRFEVEGRREDRVLRIRRPQEEFYFALPAQPTTVRVDPDLALLANLRFNPPRAMVLRMLADTNDVVGRLRAVELLGGQKDAESIRALGLALREDPFRGVRQEAARVLRELGTDEALKALMSARQQPDARVRLAVWNSLSGFYRPEVRDVLLESVATERNPDIAASQLRGLGGFPEGSVRARLEVELGLESYDDVRLRAALAALRTHANPASAPALRSAIGARGPSWGGQALAAALETLAALDRESDDRRESRDLLLRHLDHPRRAVQLAAIRGLGTLGDPVAAGPLQALEGSTRGEPGVADAARKALMAIREGRPASVELGDLRREVMALQQESRELQSAVETLRAQGRGGTAPSTNAPAERVRSRSPRERP